MNVKKVMPLNTAGPFHTEKLVKCSEFLKEELDKTAVNFNDNIQVVKNIDGKVYKNTDDIRETLSKHIMNPVRFDLVLQTMLDNAIDTFVEVGPRQSIIRICKKNEQTRKYPNC